VQSAVNGWGTSNFAGRTIAVTVNGTGTAVTTVGAALPAKAASDYYHFSSSAGQLSYASVYWW
jgi:xyloglucan-specific exo-beta-1,4-glucanase